MYLVVEFMNEKKLNVKSVDPYKLNRGLIWIGSIILMICAVYMIILKTLNDYIAIAVLLGATYYHNQLLLLHWYGQSQR